MCTDYKEWHDSERNEVRMKWVISLESNYDSLTPLKHLTFSFANHWMRAMIYVFIRYVQQYNYNTIHNMHALT